jgi:serine/threonine protein kinase
MTSIVSSTPDAINTLAEDFIARYRRGERPSVSEYVKQFPEVAHQVADVIQVLLLMEDLGAEEADAGIKLPETMPDRLGEYRIVRAIGRGGMGIVYEAIQDELGRHVALKVLTPSALLKPRHFLRFRREAQAAARLHHSNIVPVFGVGVHDGTHFYAMQFIQGQSLDAVLKQVREQRQVAHDSGSTEIAANAQSTLSGLSSPAHYARAVAQVGLQIADALEHAHATGVLHRDVKPSNILLDQEGRAWLSDFGLAQCEAVDVLTETGEIVGTFRYMAAERFQRQADARSDIYALGLTLYEMATLQPAFQETERPKLIHQILKEDPESPRQIDPSIPRDLETIILKAITKEPEARYQRAGDLASDLSRFLSDRPVTARRLNWWERGWRWTRRNRALAASTMIAFTGLTVGLGLTYWQWQRAELASDAKDEQRKDAVRSAETARLHGLRADAYAEQSERMLDTVLAEIVDFPERVTTNEARKRLLAAALEVQQGFLASTPGDTRSALQTARLTLRTADLYRSLQDRVNATRTYEDLQIQLNALGTLDDTSRRELQAACWYGRGLLLRRFSGQYDEAQKLLRQSLEAYEALQREKSNRVEYRFLYSRSAQELSAIFADRGLYDEAIALLRRALERQEQGFNDLTDPVKQERESADIAHYLLRLAALNFRQQRFMEARQICLEAETKITDMAKRWPNYLSLQAQLAACYDTLAQINLEVARTETRQGKTLSQNLWEETTSLGKKGLVIYERLVSQAPSVLEYRIGYGALSSNHALALLRQGKTSEAERSINTAIGQTSEALRQAPGNIGYNRYLRSQYMVQADIFLFKKDHAAAAQTADRILQMQDSSGSEGMIAARIWSHCLPLVPVDQRLGNAERTKKLQEYRSKALNGMRLAAEKGTLIKASDVDTYWLNEFKAIADDAEFKVHFEAIKARALSRGK